jgi:hypothetical protein
MLLGDNPFYIDNRLCSVDSGTTYTQSRAEAECGGEEEGFKPSVSLCLPVDLSRQVKFRGCSAAFYARHPIYHVDCHAELGSSSGVL